jgi:phytoene synthase
MADRFASAEDLETCRRSIRGGSKSFYAASLLLPREMRTRAYALYGFCRRADDAVDDGADAAAACAALSDRLDAIYAGAPKDDAVDRALADVVRDCAIPKDLPAALIEGFAWDAEGRSYETIGAVRAYGARVAGSVGAMMALVMGVRSAEASARACDLGVAMQLTNIARDVGEDARNGRLYLPRAWMREAGLDPDAWLADPKFDDRLGSVVERLLAEADRLYDRARPGVALLPRACRPAIHAAARIYRAIGQEAAAAGWDTVSRRAVTSKRRKLALAAAGLADAAGSRNGYETPPLPETRFLVQALPPAPELEQDPSWWRVDAHWGRMIEILHDVSLRERASSHAQSLQRSGRG